MKRISLLILLSVFFYIFIAAGCGGGGSGNSDSEDPVDAATAARLNTVQGTQTQINTQIQAAVIDFYSNISGGPEAPSDSKKFSLSKPMIKTPDGGTGDWFGPDSEGWYHRRLKWGYGDDYMDEYYRNLPSPEVGIESKTEYVMGSINEGRTTITTHSKTAIDAGLLNGFYDMEWESSGGDTNTSGSYRYTFKYSDVDPETGAGGYQWWWGGGINDYFPYGHYLTITATDSGADLHVEVNWEFDSSYNDTSWNFDCPYKSINFVEGYLQI